MKNEEQRWSVRDWTPGGPFHIGISIRHPYCDAFVRGTKAPRTDRKHGKVQIEYRTWKTAHRGPIVLVASSALERRDRIADADLARVKALPRGCTYALADLVDIEGFEGSYDWMLVNVRPLVPQPIKGRIFTYAIDRKLVQLAKPLHRVA